MTDEAVRATLVHNVHTSWRRSPNITKRPVVRRWSESWQRDAAKKTLVASRSGTWAPWIPSRYECLGSHADDSKRSRLLLSASIEYVPQWTWEVLATDVSRLRRDLTSPPAKLAAATEPHLRCLTREAFLTAYRQVQAEVKPVIDMCLPPRRSYNGLALASRRSTEPASCDRRLRSQFRHEQSDVCRDDSRGQTSAALARADPP